RHIAHYDQVTDKDSLEDYTARCAKTRNRNPADRTKSVNRYRRCAAGGFQFFDTGSDGARNLVEALRSGASFARCSDGFSGIAADADARIDFDFAENGHAVCYGGF